MNTRIDTTINTTINTTKFMFYFRTENSIQKAISKITELLWIYNSDNSILKDSKYILNIYNPSLGDSYYKKQIRF